jgi:hypothetical protein
MKRVLIASLFSLTAVPVFANPTPSFNDFPEQGKLEAGRAVSVSIPASFNDFPEQGKLEAGRVAGLAGRAAVEIEGTKTVIWTPAY